MGDRERVRVDQASSFRNRSSVPVTAIAESFPVEVGDRDREGIVRAIRSSDREAPDVRELESDAPELGLPRFGPGIHAREM